MSPMPLTWERIRHWLDLIRQVLHCLYRLLTNVFYLLRWIWDSSLWSYLAYCYHILSQNPLWYPVQTIQGLKGTPLKHNLEKLVKLAKINFAVALLFALLMKVALAGAQLNWCGLFFTLQYYCLMLIDVGRSIYFALLYMLYAKILHHQAVSLPNFVQDSSLRAFASLRDSPAFLCILREVSSAVFYLTGSLAAYFIGIHVSRAVSFLFGAYLIGHAAVDYKLSHAMLSTQGTMDVAESQHLYYLGLGLPVKAVALLESMLWNFWFGVNESFLEGPLILLLLVVIHAHDLPIVDEYPNLVLHLVPTMPTVPPSDGMYCEYPVEKELGEDGVMVEQDIFKIRLAYRGKWVMVDLNTYVTDVGFVRYRIVKVIKMPSASLMLQLPEEYHRPIWQWIDQCKQAHTVSTVATGSSSVSVSDTSPLPTVEPLRSLIIQKNDAKAAKSINAAVTKQFEFVGIKYHRAPRMPVSISPRLQRLAHWLLRRTFEAIVTLIKSAAAHQAEIARESLASDELTEEQRNSEKHFPLMQWLEAFPYTWYGSILKRVLWHFYRLDCGQQLVQQRSNDLKLLVATLTQWRGEILHLLQGLKITASAEQYLSQAANVITTFYVTVAETSLTEISSNVRKQIISQIAAYSGLSKDIVDSVLLSVIRLSPFHTVLHQARTSADSFQSLFFLSPGEVCQLISAVAKISYKLELERVIETLIPSGEGDKAVDSTAGSTTAEEDSSSSSNRETSSSSTASSSLHLLSTVLTADADDANSDLSQMSSVSAVLVESTIQVSQIVTSASIRLRTWSKSMF